MGSRNGIWYCALIEAGEIPPLNGEPSEGREQVSKGSCLMVADFVKDMSIG